MFTLEGERTFFGPGADHQVVRLVKPFMADGRVGSHRIIFAALTPDHPADQPPAGDAIDHRVLFGKRLRMVAHTEGIAENGDLDLRCPPGKRRRHHHRRRHQPVSVLVVLVDANAVETQFVCVFEFVEVPVIKLVPLHRIEIGVGVGHPACFVIPVIVGIDIGIGHQMKHKDFHPMPFNARFTLIPPRPSR